MSAVGALVGLTVAVGILLAAGGWLALRPPSLADRIGSRSRRAPTGPLGPLGTWLEIVRPWAGPLGRFMDREASAGLARRLARAGRSVDIEAYRLEQLLWGAGGAVAGVVLSILAGPRSGNSVPFALVVVGVAVTVALLIHDRRLGTQARRRGQRMAEQLPTVAELLAFAVSAGETPLAALDRVGRTVDGDLAEDLSVIVHDVRGGASIVTALHDAGDRAPHQSVARFVDGVAIASERGTPMADVLRAQAADARAAGRRLLMEQSGKREILMLAPVVFLILPIVVVIALFPGVHGLNLTVT